ncbi:SDR family NAD(P)-dependent oxidoreductase [Aspergillus affinis]|uniref:SDR family NAD(P)-dependent oxidoreductase n=1 Tax=Aspergillus affinis TaxID=1070780 RepID=UPI0022FEDA4D|nr:oxidoreductase [Aspergillus affinis]KAI9043095.1 oxidoreductase [Aspergillus affinis]
MAAPTSLLPGGIAVVTGAASGIGRDTALALAQAGVEGLVLADLEPADAVVEESRTFATHANLRAISVQTDVADESSVDSLVELAVKEFGRIDYCVHSAGMGNISGATTEHVKPNIFDQTLSINARGTMLILRAVSAAMAKQEPREHKNLRAEGTRSLGRGSIVVVGSINSIMAAPGMLSYCASKWAVLGMAKTAAMDNIPHHIRVNTVCPAWTQTPMMERSLKRVPQLGAMVQALSPLKRGAFPEEVSDAIVFLCSPGASYINGTVITVDAGATVTTPKAGL